MAEAAECLAKRLRSIVYGLRTDPGRTLEDPA